MRTESVCGEPKTRVVFVVGFITEMGLVMDQP